MTGDSNCVEKNCEETIRRVSCSPFTSIMISALLMNIIFQNRVMLRHQCHQGHRASASPRGLGQCLQRRYHRVPHPNILLLSSSSTLSSSLSSILSLTLLSRSPKKSKSSKSKFPPNLQRNSEVMQRPDFSLKISQRLTTSYRKYSRAFSHFTPSPSRCNTAAYSSTTLPYTSTTISPSSTKTKCLLAILLFLLSTGHTMSVIQQSPYYANWKPTQSHRVSPHIKHLRQPQHHQSHQQQQQDPQLQQLMTWKRQFQERSPSNLLLSMNSDSDSSPSPNTVLLHTKKVNDLLDMALSGSALDSALSLSLSLSLSLD